MNPLAVEKRIRQRAKESGRGPCPGCGGWMLQPVSDEENFCVECGTYSTKQGTAVSKESLIASGVLIWDEEAGVPYAARDVL